MEKIIYLDNAATTKTAPEVVEAMMPYFTENFGNPSSVYTFSNKGREAVLEARETIAKTIGAKKENDSCSLNLATDKNVISSSYQNIETLTEKILKEPNQTKEKKSNYLTYKNIDEIITYKNINCNKYLQKK